MVKNDFDDSNFVKEEYLEHEHEQAKEIMSDGIKLQSSGTGLQRSHANILFW